MARKTIIFFRKTPPSYSGGERYTLDAAAADAFIAAGKAKIAPPVFVPSPGARAERKTTIRSDLEGAGFTTQKSTKLAEIFEGNEYNTKRDDNSLYKKSKRLVDRKAAIAVKADQGFCSISKILVGDFALHGPSGTYELKADSLNAQAADTINKLIPIVTKDALGHEHVCCGYTPYAIISASTFAEQGIDDPTLTTSALARGRGFVKCTPDIDAGDTKTYTVGDTWTVTIGFESTTDANDDVLPGIGFSVTPITVDFEVV